jgi:hypothetical protein
VHAHEQQAGSPKRTPLVRPPRHAAGPSTDTASPKAAALLNLQRAAGNAAVSRALAGRSAAVSVQLVRDSRYEPGTYGSRRQERRRLEDEYGARVTGDRLQAEHGIAYGATARYAPASRRENRVHEGEIGAYYETHDAHRAHRGTGSGTTVHDDGLSSVSYRDRQEEYLFNDDPHSALLINQVGYNIDEFHRDSGTTAARQSDDSFHGFLEANPRTPYYDSAGTRRSTRRLAPREQADLSVIRSTLRGGSRPSEEEQYSTLRHFGGSRFDDYPTRSRGRADPQELTDFFDVRDRSASPLRVPSDYGGSRSRRDSRYDD